MPRSFHFATHHLITPQPVNAASLATAFIRSLPTTAAAMWPGNIKFLDNQVWLRSIGERNEMINEKSNQVAAFFSNETMKIGRRTAGIPVRAARARSRQSHRHIFRTPLAGALTEASLEYRLRLLFEFPYGSLPDAELRVRCSRCPVGGADASHSEAATNLSFPEKFRRATNFRRETFVDGQLSAVCSRTSRCG
jgi:hypothetical protein